MIHLYRHTEFCPQDRIYTISVENNQLKSHLFITHSSEYPYKNMNLLLETFHKIKRFDNFCKKFVINGIICFFKINVQCSIKYQGDFYILLNNDISNSTNSIPNKFFFNKSRLFNTNNIGQYLCHA